MAKAQFSFHDLLAVPTRTEVRAALMASRMRLSLPEAQKLRDRLQNLEPAARPLRLAVLHTYTSELLDPWLALEAEVQGLRLDTFHAPYGMTIQQARNDSELVVHRPDLTLLMLQRGDLHPDLSRPLSRFAPAEQEELRAEIMLRLKAMLEQFRKLKIGQIVLTLLPANQGPGMGIFDAQADRSEVAWWATLKHEIGQFLRESLQAALLLDLDEVVQQVGRAGFFDQRLWYSARFPFAPDAAREFARRVMALGVVMKFPRAKVIVLDADNTLWGGIVGEDGIDGIALGPDYPGSTFLEFQRRLLDYQQRGFILALCSKNNQADVDEVLRDHPHQILRSAHFAASRVNWLPKPDNLESLAEELNLGLDSFVFVDDSDHECAAVRQRLPQVEVIQTPSRQIDIPFCLEQVARLEVLSLTAEDRAKTAMYAQERKRRELRDHAESSGAGLDDYLGSLEMRMQVCLDNAAHVTRLSQMTQKTNQFNLTTRRYDEQRMKEFVSGGEWLVADFALSDVFGHSGVAGLAIFRRPDPLHAELDTLLMSCRVIGREAESAFLHSVLRHLAQVGVQEVVADFLPTAKNSLAKTFLPDQGFVASVDGRYRWNLAETAPRPENAFRIAVSLEI